MSHEASVIMKTLLASILFCRFIAFALSSIEDNSYYNHILGRTLKIPPWTRNISLAVFNGLDGSRRSEFIHVGSGIHDEMLGHVLEYAISRQIDVTIFLAKLEDDHLGWPDFYRKLFRNLKFEDTSKLNSSDFDVVIQVTDIDDTFKPTNWENVITIDHFYQERLHDPKYRVGTRPFTPRINASFTVLPSYRVTTLEQKLAAIAGFTVPRVCVVGHGFGAHDADAVRKQINNFADVDFFVTRRHGGDAFELEGSHNYGDVLHLQVSDLTFGRQDNMIKNPLRLKNDLVCIFIT